MAISFANNKNIKELNSKNKENITNNIHINNNNNFNNKINNKNILKGKANRNEIKIERPERIIKINKNCANAKTGTNAEISNNNENNIVLTKPKSELIITLREEKNQKEIILVKKNDTVIDVIQRQPRKIEIVLPEKLLCENQESLLSNNVQIQSKEVMRIGNNLVRISQKEFKSSCEFFCDYLHTNNPQYLVDICSEIYGNIIDDQVKSVFVFEFSLNYLLNQLFYLIK